MNCDPTFVIPSEVEESLIDSSSQIRDVSTALDMTKASARDGRARCQLIFLPPCCHSERSRAISNYFLMSRDYNFWVYIVTNVHDSVLYIGITNDLARRVSEHRSGEVPGFTAAYRFRKLIYYEHCRDVRDAIAREKQLKKWSLSKKVALIKTLNPHWLDLASAVLGEEQEMPVPAGKLFR